jgi:hypothetical protein
VFIIQLIESANVDICEPGISPSFFSDTVDEVQLTQIGRFVLFVRCTAVDMSFDTKQTSRRINEVLLALSARVQRKFAH